MLESSNSILLNKSNVLVLVPALNEAMSVGDVLIKLLEVEFNVLLISDGSTDKTALIGRTIGVPVLELPINLGVGGALRSGFTYAIRNGYEAVIQVELKLPIQPRDLGLFDNPY
jgi:glycosyltransferase involved in cell wall biosynthesis